MAINRQLERYSNLMKWTPRKRDENSQNSKCGNSQNSKCGIHVGWKQRDEGPPENCLKQKLLYLSNNITLGKQMMVGHKPTRVPYFLF